MTLAHMVMNSKKTRKKLRLAAWDGSSIQESRRQVTLERVGRRLCLLALQGLSHAKIAKRFGVTAQTISAWLKEPGIVELLDEMQHSYFERLERMYLRLDAKAIKRVGSLIMRGSEEGALETIKMYWQTRGRYNPRGAETNIYNSQVAAAQATQNPLQRDEAQEILQALRVVRDRKASERPISGTE